MSGTQCAEVMKPVVSLYFAGITAREVSKNMGKQQNTRREARSSGEGIKLHKLTVDESDAMQLLMKQAVPVFAPRCGIISGRKTVSVEEEQREMGRSPFEELLDRGIEEGLAKIENVSKPPRQSEDALEKEEANKHSPRSASRVSREATAARKALQVWTEEESAQGRIDSGTYSFHTCHSLVGAVDRGRFPLDANLTVSKAVKRVEEDLKQCAEGDKYSASSGVPLPPPVKGDMKPRATLLDRLRKIPVRSWDLLYNITTVPCDPDKGRRGGKQYVQEGALLPRKWRHRFDYVNYQHQFEIDKALSARDICRNMVIRHEKRTSQKVPMAALADMFEQQTSATGQKAKQRKFSGKDEVMWCSVWARRANEIALERQRHRIINAVKEFKLCVEAANLSRLAVGRLQKDLIKVIQEWPSDYRKRHIFTSANFVEWVKSRCGAPSSGGSDKAAHLAESMASTAEASFVEYVLSILPPGSKARPQTR